MDTLEKAENLVKTEVLCALPSILLDHLISLDDFQESMTSYDDENDEYSEPLEFWFVSSWLGEKLKSRLGFVYDLGTCYVWGRETSGQVIYLDGIIQDIAHKMGR